MRGPHLHYPLYIHALIDAQELAITKRHTRDQLYLETLYYIHVCTRTYIWSLAFAQGWRCRDVRGRMGRGNVRAALFTDVQVAYRIAEDLGGIPAVGCYSDIEPRCPICPSVRLSVCPSVNGELISYSRLHIHIHINQPPPHLRIHPTAGNLHISRIPLGSFPDKAGWLAGWDGYYILCGY